MSKWSELPVIFSGSNPDLEELGIDDKENGFAMVCLDSVIAFNEAKEPNQTTIRLSHDFEGFIINMKYADFKEKMIKEGFI